MCARGVTTGHSDLGLNFSVCKRAGRRIDERPINNTPWPTERNQHVLLFVAEPRRDFLCASPVHFRRFTPPYAPNGVTLMPIFVLWILVGVNQGGERAVLWVSQWDGRGVPLTVYLKYSRPCERESRARATHTHTHFSSSSVGCF